MEHFFDLKEFLVAIIRRAKLIIIITIAASIIAALFSFVPLALEYINYKEPETSQASDDVFKDTNQPFYYKAIQAVYFKPEYKEVGGTITDVSTTLPYLYANTAFSKEVFDPLIKKYYNEFVKDFEEHRKKMVDFNYQIRSVLNKEITVSDFYQAFTAEIFSVNIINIGVKTGSAELSERMVVDFEKNLSTAIIQKREADYSVTQLQTKMSLPDPELGLVPKIGTGTSEDTKITKPLLSEIILQTGKMTIYGFLAGFVVSILLVVILNLFTTKIVTESDLKIYNKRIFATTFSSKKRKFKLIDRFINKLEGDVLPDLSRKDTALLVAERIKVMPCDSSHVLITGLSSEAKEFAELIKEFDESVKFSYAPCITTNAETIKEAQNSTVVLLVEQSGVSSKNEVKKEINEFELLEKQVIGFVLVK